MAGATLKTTEDKKNESKFKRISRKHLPSKGQAVTATYALTVLSSGNDSPDAVRTCLNELQQLKSRIQSFARHAIKIIMYEAAVEAGMTATTVDGTQATVDKYGAIGDSWKEDGSLRNAEKLFAVTYMWFDRHPWWYLTLEHDFMVENKLRYDDTIVPSPPARPGVSKTMNSVGCIARLIKNQKTEIVKSINCKSNTTHRRRVTITRSPTVQKGTPSYRRQKAVFECYFLKDAKGNAVCDPLPQVIDALTEISSLTKEADHVTVISVPTVAPSVVEIKVVR